MDVLTELEAVRTRGTRPSALLAGWVQSPPTWSPVLRRLAGTSLVAQHGDTGRVLAWVLGDVADRARQVLTHGALLSVAGDVPKGAWGTLEVLRDEARSPLRAPSVARRIVVELALMNTMK